jgi:hypothetical protein
MLPNFTELIRRLIEESSLNHFTGLGLGSHISAEVLQQWQSPASRAEWKAMGRSGVSAALITDTPGFVQKAFRK